MPNYIYRQYVSTKVINLLIINYVILKIYSWFAGKSFRKRLKNYYQDKKWHNEDGNKTVSCDEFETKIENLDALKKLFENLNFKELISVEKNRSIWNFKDTEIAID